MRLTLTVALLLNLCACVGGDDERALGEEWTTGNCERPDPVPCLRGEWDHDLYFTQYCADDDSDECVCHPHTDPSCQHHWIGELYECTANVPLPNIIADELRALCWGDDGEGKPWPAQVIADEAETWACPTDGTECEIACVDTRRTCHAMF